MGLSNRIVLVRIVEHFGAQGADVHRVAHKSWLLRLAAAVDTSSRTTHDLDKMIISFTRFHLIEKGSRISKSRGNSHFYVHSSHMISGFLDAFHAPDICKV